jgi:ribosome-binding protein aMBF1 (putative translation factor)
MDDLQKHIRESLSHPEFRTVWEETGPEYQVARQLVSLRLKNGLTQKDLARCLGTTQSVIARIERGNQNLSIRTLTKLARALGADLRIEIRPGN